MTRLKRISRARRARASSRDRRPGACERLSMQIEHLVAFTRAHIVARRARDETRPNAFVRVGVRFYVKRTRI